ncbi:MAG: DoxX family protein [Hydrocarboniphaga sp.]|uniref:DoxX family protein n=1 Tax=Hydrocarboniphaga sp. TaxID=2033016 RepID=UPI00260C68CE|nr:DoxX family protein [Hydrocarboniphaga sp.]MDB5967753.1 DoxX family protein [Hydrocarboniphaga sp.]
MNSLPASVITMYRALVGAAERLSWLAPLLMRLVFGYFWLETGWAKLHNLDGFTERFISWGIPFPAFSAGLSAWAEFIGGGLMMAGLATRATMVAMIVNMLVAMALVVLPTISTLDEFVELDETIYVLALFWLLMAGPGKASLDHLIAKRLEA